jgi:hypothetical protein
MTHPKGLHGMGQPIGPGVKLREGETHILENQSFLVRAYESPFSQERSDVDFHASCLSFVKILGVKVFKKFLPQQIRNLP